MYQVHPILERRLVVGIVARRDLLAVLARSDDDIARDLEGCWRPSWARPARTGDGAGWGVVLRDLDPADPAE